MAWRQGSRGVMGCPALQGWWSLQKKGRNALATQTEAHWKKVGVCPYSRFPGEKLGATASPYRPATGLRAGFYRLAQHHATGFSS